MNRNFHNSRGSSTYAGKPIPRWRTAFIALVLALAIGSMGPSAPVQAAPAGDTIISFSLKASYAASQSRICAGDNVLINVTVLSQVQPEVDAPGDELTPLPTRLTGIRVTASVRDTFIGTVAFPERETGWTSGDSPGVAPFVFHAKNPGRTTISFEARIPTQWFLGLVYRQDIAAGELDVTVEQCQYKVTTISTFRAGMTSVGTIDETIITLDEAGRFEGGANVTWVTSMICGISSPIQTSTATLVAEMIGGDLKVEVIFDPSSSIGGGNCGVAVTTSNIATLSPLTITVPSWGGSATKAQTVKAKNGTFTGSAIIIVTPVNPQ